MPLNRMGTQAEHDSQRAKKGGTVDGSTMDNGVRPAGDALPDCGSRACRVRSHFTHETGSTLNPDPRRHLHDVRARAWYHRVIQ